MKKIIDFLDRCIAKVFEVPLAFCSKHMDKNWDVANWIFGRGLGYWIVTLSYLTIIFALDAAFALNGLIVVWIFVYGVIVGLLAMVLGDCHNQFRVEKVKILEPLIEGLCKLPFAILGIIPVFLVVCAVKMILWLRQKKILLSL